MRGTSSVTATITALRPMAASGMGEGERGDGRGFLYQLAAEDLAEMPDRCGGDLGQRRRPAGESLDRGHPHLVQAAGDDAREVGEVGRDVQGEAVGGDPARQVDADRGDLLLPHPDADELLAVPRLGGDAMAGQGADEHLLEIADVAA